MTTSIVLFALMGAIIGAVTNALANRLLRHLRQKRLSEPPILGRLDDAFTIMTATRRKQP